MQRREQLQQQQAKVREELEGLKNKNKTFPDDLDAFEREYKSEKDKRDSEWNLLMDRIGDLKKKIRKEGYNAKQQKLEKDLNVLNKQNAAFSKAAQEAKNKYMGIVENKDFQKYEKLYFELKNINAELAKLDTNTQTLPKLQVEDVTSPSINNSSPSPEAKNASLPGWITSCNPTKEIHLSANLLSLPNKDWLDQFVKNNKLELRSLQDDQKMVLTSQGARKGEIVCEKNSVSASFDAKDTDEWLKIVIDLYIQSIKNMPCQNHQIKTQDSVLQQKFEQALATALKSNSLLSKETMINDKLVNAPIDPAQAGELESDSKGPAQR